MKNLIYTEYIHDVTSKSYSVIQQNFTGQIESDRKLKMHTELESIHLQHLLSHD